MLTQNQLIKVLNYSCKILSPSSCFLDWTQGIQVQPLLNEKGLNKENQRSAAHGTFQRPAHHKSRKELLGLKSDIFCDLYYSYGKRVKRKNPQVLKAFNEPLLQTYHFKSSEQNLKGQWYGFYSTVEEIEIQTAQITSNIPSMLQDNPPKVKLSLSLFFFNKGGS